LVNQGPTDSFIGMYTVNDRDKLTEWATTQGQQVQPGKCITINKNIYKVPVSKLIQFQVVYWLFSPSWF